MNTATKTNLLENLSNTVSSALARKDYSKALHSLLQMDAIITETKNLKDRNTWTEIVDGYAAQFNCAFRGPFGGLTVPARSGVFTERNSTR